MLRKAIARLQPLVDRNAAVNARWLSDYHKSWEQSREIASKSVTPPNQGGSILQETPEERARVQQLDPYLQKLADPVDGERWTCGASGYTKQECEARFPYPPTPPAASLDTRIRLDARIKLAVLNAISEKPLLTHEANITVATKNGEVTLTGTASSLVAYTLAEATTSAVPGVVAVHNDLKSPLDEQIERDVMNALKRESVPKSVVVSIKNREVTLTGTVPRYRDYTWAEGTISNVSGVIKVHNNLQVAWYSLSGIFQDFR